MRTLLITIILLISCVDDNTFSFNLEEGRTRKKTEATIHNTMLRVLEHKMTLKLPKTLDEVEFYDDSLVDEWGNEVFYEIGEQYQLGYIIGSYGKDGVKSGDDLILLSAQNNEVLKTRSEIERTHPSIQNPSN